MGRFKGDEIVISGMAGCFPGAENVEQLNKNLYNKVDMVTKTEMYSHIKHPELPQYSGQIKGTEKFDAQFFRVTQWQAASLDPVGRMIMEQTFSAFLDAGINPETIKGSKLGVFIGSMQTDVGTLSLYNVFKHNGFIISGCSRTMLANRISYWVDGKGPSYGFDNGCAASMAALEMACNRIKFGEIDCAVVGGTNLCIHPVLNIVMKRAGLLCMDGKTKCFDKNGDGYARSDAMNVFFLQRAKDAKRIYAEVYHVKGKYFAAPDASFLPTRNPKDLEKFFEEFYSEIDVSPQDVAYVEANASGIAEADGNELEAIGNIFGKNKTVKIGCVKSNMGNTESASGACSLTKMCLAFNNGKIPANLHYCEPQNHLQAVREGRLQVVTEHASFDRKFCAINNFCYTGANFHTLLKGHYKPKGTDRYKSPIPRLVLASGRQEESVNKILDILETSPLDPELYALLSNFFKHNVPGHTGRGYTILDLGEHKETVALSRGFEFYSGNTRPIWFVYSGMGSQWAGMGEDLLRIPIFAAAIERCHKVLLTKGLDIVKIITDKDSGSLNIINSMVGITATQIGLTDILKSLGIAPDNIIGHSVGELASAYADECLTAEQTILASYSRAIVSYETEFIKGKMAAVGLGHKEVSQKCPPEIQVACHNSSESATISGPADIVTEFINNLTEQGIFAKEVASSNIAFHSKYIAKAGPDMLALQKQFITEPKQRSKKWLSTCYLPEDWHKPESKYASAEYFTHNLLSSVLFEEAAELIPDDAIIIEIAPHGLLQAILKRSHSQCTNISLTRRGEKKCVKLLLETIGKLYQFGLNPDTDVLYPKVEFPVSTETPVLSHFVGWEHSIDWPVDKFELKEQNTTSSKEFIFSIHDDEYSFLKDHVRNGVNVVPEAAMLVFVWDTLATSLVMDYRDLSVVFDDIKFYRPLVIKSEEVTKINVTLQRGLNRFEITNENIILADGFIIEVDKTTKKCGNIILSENELHLNQVDIYTLLSVRGYSYEGEFQSIKSTNMKRTKATIKWNDTWITFLDSLIQFNALSENHDGVSNAKLINKLTINIDEHRKFRYTADGVQLYNALILKNIGQTKCGGVIFEDIILTDIPKIVTVPQTYKTRKFMSHFHSYDVDLHTALQVNLQILRENITNNVINIKEITTEEHLININKLEEITKEIPLLKINVETIKVQSDGDVDEIKMIDADVIILQNLLKNHKIVKEIVNNIHKSTYIMCIEKGTIEETAIKLNKLETVTKMRISNDSTIVLLKKGKQFHKNNTSIVIAAQDQEFSVSKLNKDFKEDENIILIVEKSSQLSIQGFTKEVKKYDNIYLFIMDAKSPKFSITNNYYKEQLQKGLKVNIHENGHWGSYCYAPVSTLNRNEVKSIKLIAKKLNSIESLAWEEASVKLNKRTVQVCYSGLSTKDCKNLSESKENKCFGMDFSGMDCNGQRVMGLLPKGAMANTVQADCDLLWPVPQHWSMVEAASVPLPYVHAFYCLAIRSYLPRNSNILVIGAAGTLGQAVIAVAHSLGCTVFATVSNAHKKRFLLRLFPELDENNIGYTYDNTFCEMVITRTKDERCSIVISCGTGTVRQAAMSCVGFSQNFLDVNDSHYKENNKFGFFYLREAKSYKSVNISNIFHDKYSTNKKVLQVMLSDGIAKGFVRPLTSVVYIPYDIPRAFLLISNRNNRGRVLINMKDKLSKQNFEITPRITLAENKSYIVMYDGTELGIELINRLVQRGARRLLVHCKPKLINGYFHVKYESWCSLGVHIEFSHDDLQIESSYKNLIEKGSKLGFINGIFIAQSGLNKRCKTISEECEIDVSAIASNLNIASLKCNSLQYFVVMVTTSRNSDNVNAFEEIEKCCLLRNDLGLPSLFLQHILNDKKPQPNCLSTLLNAMESSLRHQHINVLTTDSIIERNEEHATKKMNTNFYGGLEAFYNHILEDEITATEPIIQMKTNLTSGYENELLLKSDNTYLMMIPGIEGNFEALTYISQKLKQPAIALQLDSNMRETSTPEIAKNLLKNVRLRFHLKSPFYIMGYSFGVNVALELAALLEKEGLVGVVYCLDSSPDAMRVHLNAYLGNLTDEQLQNSLVEHIFKLLAGHESRELKNKLEETTKWSDKIDIFTSEIKKHVSHSQQYLKDLLQAGYNRIKMSKEYKPEFNLESELVLIKGIPHPNAEQITNDYNLSRYTNKSVQVYNIESDHALAPLDCRVSNFINKTLVP